MKQSRGYGFGVLLMIIGAVFLSTNGIMLRQIEQADGWQILFYRGIAFSVTVFSILVFKYRRNSAHTIFAIGQRGIWAGLALGLSSCFYVFALLLTTIANAMFIIGAAPLATAFAACNLFKRDCNGSGRFHRRRRSGDTNA